MSNNHLSFHEQWNFLKYIFDEDIVLDTNEKARLYSIIYNMCCGRSPNNYSEELYDNFRQEIKKMMNKERLRRRNNPNDRNALEKFDKLKKTILFVFKPLKSYAFYHNVEHLENIFEFNTVIEI